MSKSKSMDIALSLACKVALIYIPDNCYDPMGQECVPLLY